MLERERKHSTGLKKWISESDLGLNIWTGYFISEFEFSHLGSNYPNGSNLLGLLGGLNEIMHKKYLPQNVAHVSASSRGHQGILRGSI